MSTSINWSAIRTEYEAGISQRSLATKYGVQQSSISRRAANENWRIIPRITPTPESIIDASTSTDLSDMAKIKKAIALIYERLEQKPEDKNIKLLMDSLSQAQKIKMLLPMEDQGNNPDSLRQLLAKATDEELAIILPAIKAISARDAEVEGITPLRKHG